MRTSDWFVVAGGDGFQTRNDPEDPNIVYASSQDGNVSRYDVRTGISKSIRPPQSRSGRGFGGGDDAMAGGVPAGAPQAAAPQRRTGRAGRRGAAARCGGDRANWDAPYIISPHAPKRLYWASNRLYRSDDRGDTWTVVSPDLSRNLNRDEIPIMGKLWPADSIARNTSTTALSNIVSLDESPLFEGLIYAGTDDGLVQVTEDGGKNWRRVEDFPGVPKWTYVTRRLRVAARREHRVRHAQQLAARRLQAVHREERRPRADVDAHHRRPARRATMCGRSSRTT